MKEQPLITVALPLWNMGKIAWLSLESLCRQQVAVPWELIFLQEVSGHETFDISPYIERLKEAGCVEVKTIHFDEKVTLPKKWQAAGKAASDSSVVFVLQAGDCYSPPDRLDKSYEAIDSGGDWFDQAVGIFYFIQDGRIIVYDGREWVRERLNNLNMCFKTRYARTIPDTDINKGVDGFLYLHCKGSNPNFIKTHRSDVVLTGLDTHGHNTISINRHKYFNKPRVPFSASRLTLADLDIPTDIVDRLNLMRAK